eukprot:15464104-Alexandrium_andersonii.AAC.1
MLAEHEALDVGSCHPLFRNFEQPQLGHSWSTFRTCRAKVGRCEAYAWGLNQSILNPPPSTFNQVFTPQQHHESRTVDWLKLAWQKHSRELGDDICHWTLDSAHGACPSAELPIGGAARALCKR